MLLTRDLEAVSYIGLCLKIATNNGKMKALFSVPYMFH